ncbi:MAG: MotA/TolQ/ExbB proton channel family protein [Granulosicoccus sp.]
MGDSLPVSSVLNEQSFVPGVFAGIEQLLQLSGAVGLLLLIMLTVVIAISLVKIWQFLATGIFFSRVGNRLEQLAGRYAADADVSATNIASGGPPVAIMQSAISHLQNNQLNSDELTSELKRQLDGYGRTLRTHHKTLELIGSLAPLLGLLGTVLGMIEAFRQMQAAGQSVDPSLLSGGIWQALLTTAMGISVAIPAIAMHTWLENSADNHLGHLADQLNRVLTLSRLGSGWDHDRTA